MVTIDGLMDPALLAAEIEQGYVIERAHPTLPLRILNYGARTQSSWRWNDVTEQCRGLIYDASDRRVVARPFRKFFSVEQMRPAGVEIPADEPFRAYEKLDGSLGISYPDPDGRMRIATRGSFVSEQALKATELLDEYGGTTGVDLDPSYTYLFEILYPANRIVVDYGNRAALVLLAAIRTETGLEDEDAAAYAAVRNGFPQPRVYEFSSYDEALYAVDCDERFLGQEGLVLHFRSGLRVKLKADEYQRLHRLVTRVTPKAIWRHLSEGRYVGSLTYGLWSDPAAWILEHAERLQARHAAIKDGALVDFENARAALGADFSDRKAFALWAQRHTPETLPLLFLLYDDRADRLDAAIWKRLEPKGEDVYRPEAA